MVKVAGRAMTLRRSCERASIVFALVCCAGCGSSSGSPDAGLEPMAERRRAVLKHLAEGVIVPTYESFLVKAMTLEGALRVYAADPSEPKRDAAQAAWRDAMLVWQRAELFQVGPAGVMGQTPGGQDLRDEIYAWPFLSDCGVDAELAGEDYDDADALAAKIVSLRGLGAIEYLLFNAAATNACAGQHPINDASGGPAPWAEITEELASRRAQYAHSLAIIVRRRAQSLLDAWTTTSDGFAEQLSHAGDGSVIYPSTQEALNALSDAMFYLEKETKDMKLARPAGIAECASAICPEARESRYADYSKDEILENINAFEQVFTGGSAPEDLGFDDILTDIGASALADQMRAATVVAHDKIEVIPGTLATALSSDLDSVTDAHSSLRDLVDLLKTEFLGKLDLELPERADGDND